MVTTAQAFAPTYIDAPDSGAALRQGLLDGDALMEAQMFSAYNTALVTIEKDLHTLLKKMDKAKTEGGTIDPAWLYQSQRLMTLEQKTRAEIRKFTDKAVDITTQGQKDAIQKTLDSFQNLVVDKYGPKAIKKAGGNVVAGFVGINDPAMQNLVGRLSDGQRLNAQHFKVEDLVWEGIKSELITGAITGKNSDVIAQNIATKYALPYHRAVGLARTEIFNAQRDAAIENMRLNNDLIQGWIWSADMTPRTCAICWGKHGEKHPLDVEMRSHVSCRCVAMPWFFDDTEKDLDKRIGNGEKRFAKELSESEQKRVLGPRKFDMWKQGIIKLSDLIGTKNSPRWGKSLYEKSYVQLIAEGFNQPTPTPLMKSNLTRKEQLQYYNVQHPFQPDWNKPEMDKAYKLNTSKKSKSAVKLIADNIMQNPAALDQMRKVHNLGPQVPDTQLQYYVEQFASEMISQWNADSGDSNVRAVRFQLAAREEFGLSHAIDAYDANTVKQVKKGIGPGGPYEAGYKMDKYMVRAMYDATQKKFKAAGMTHVTVVRGVKWSSYKPGLEPQWSKDWRAEKPGEIVYAPTRVLPVEFAPLSSFSADNDRGFSFGGTHSSASTHDWQQGYILTTRVPVDQVLSFHHTGMGTDWEHEYVMLGGPGEVFVTPNDVYYDLKAPTDAMGNSLDDPTKNIGNWQQGKQKPTYSYTAPKPVKPTYTPATATTPQTTTTPPTGNNTANVPNLPANFSQPKIGEYYPDATVYPSLINADPTNVAFQKNAHGYFIINEADMASMGKLRPFTGVNNTTNDLPVKISENAYSVLLNDLVTKNGPDVSTWDQKAWDTYATYKVAAGFTPGSMVSQKVSPDLLKILNTGHAFMMVPEKDIVWHKPIPANVIPPNQAGFTQPSNPLPLGANQGNTQPSQLTTGGAAQMLTDLNTKYGVTLNTSLMSMPDDFLVEYFKIIGATPDLHAIMLQSEKNKLIDLFVSGKLDNITTNDILTGTYLHPNPIQGASVTATSTPGAQGAPTTPVGNPVAAPPMPPAGTIIKVDPNDTVAQLLDKQKVLDAMKYHAQISDQFYTFYSKKIADAVASGNHAPAATHPTITPPSTPTPGAVNATVSGLSAPGYAGSAPLPHPGKKVAVKVEPTDTVADLNNKLTLINAQLQHGMITAGTHKNKYYAIQAAIKSGKHAVGVPLVTPNIPTQPIAQPIPVTPSTVTTTPAGLTYNEVTKQISDLFAKHPNIDTSKPNTPDSFWVDYAVIAGQNQQFVSQLPTMFTDKINELNKKGVLSDLETAAILSGTYDPNNAYLAPTATPSTTQGGTVTALKGTKILQGMTNSEAANAFIALDDKYGIKTIQDLQAAPDSYFAEFANIAGSNPIVANNMPKLTKNKFEEWENTGVLTTAQFNAITNGTLAYELTPTFATPTAPTPTVPTQAVPGTAQPPVQVVTNQITYNEALKKIGDLEQQEPNLVYGNFGYVDDAIVTEYLKLLASQPKLPLSPSELFAVDEQLANGNITAAEADLMKKNQFPYPSPNAVVAPTTPATPTAVTLPPLGTPTPPPSNVPFHKSKYGPKYVMPVDVIDTGTAPPTKVIKIFPDDTVADLQKKLQYLDLQLKYGQLEASSHKVKTYQIKAAIKSGKHATGVVVTGVPTTQPVTVTQTITPMPAQSATAAPTAPSSTIPQVVTPNAQPFTHLNELTYAAPKPGGSADGALYTDKNGEKWLVKVYPDAGQVANEILAAKLYQLVGAGAPEMYSIDVGNQWPGKSSVGVASKWLDEPTDSLKNSTQAQKNLAAQDFAADAWLANWDTVGLDYDNIVIGKNSGKTYRIDPGGALLYRAMGDKKGAKFTDDVPEWDTLRNPMNAQANAIFGGMTNAQLVESAKRVLAIDDNAITALVMQYGPGTQAERIDLAKKLISRKKDLAVKAQAANNGQPVIVAPNPTIVATPTPTQTTQPTPQVDIAKLLKMAPTPNTPAQAQLFVKTFDDLLAKGMMTQADYDKIVTPSTKAFALQGSTPTPVAPATPITQTPPQPVTTAPNVVMVTLDPVPGYGIMWKPYANAYINQLKWMKKAEAAGWAPDIQARALEYKAKMDAFIAAGDKDGAHAFMNDFKAAAKAVFHGNMPKPLSQPVVAQATLPTVTVTTPPPTTVGTLQKLTPAQKSALPNTKTATTVTKNTSIATLGPAFKELTETDAYNLIDGIKDDWNVQTTHDKLNAPLEFWFEYFEIMGASPDVAIMMTTLESNKLHEMQQSGWITPEDATLIENGEFTYDKSLTPIPDFGEHLAYPNVTATPTPAVTPAQAVIPGVPTLANNPNYTKMWKPYAAAYEKQAMWIEKAKKNGVMTPAMEATVMAYKAKMDSLLDAGDIKAAHTFMADYKVAAKSVFAGKMPAPLPGAASVSVTTTFTPTAATPTPQTVAAANVQPPVQVTSTMPASTVYVSPAAVAPTKTTPNPNGLQPITTVVPVNNKKIKANVEVSMKAIGNVHTVTGVKTLPIQKPNAVEAQQNITGKMKVMKGSGEVKYIMIDPDASLSQTTLVHEYGHYLAFDVLKKSDMADVSKAISQTKTYKQLVANTNSGTYSTYLAQGHEAFARAYAQYIAIKSGDPILLSQLQQLQQSTLGVAWKNDEFEPIMHAFDALFLMKGWIV